MKRRTFIAGLGGAAAWPLAARAQQLAIPVVGLLSSATSPSPIEIAFPQGLSESGFLVGQTVAIEYRWADGHYDRLPDLAADLVRRQVNVLAASGGVQAALAAKAATNSIPIVFANGSDPVEFGLVASLNRPGGNITGVSFFTASLDAKRLGLLRELVPGASIIACLVNPTNPNVGAQVREIQEGSRVLGVQIDTLNASNQRDFDLVFERLAQRRTAALLVASDPFFFSQRQQIVTLAARYAVPAIYEWREFAESGGLASYGTNLVDAYRLAGVYTGRILRGEKPADLPVIQSTKFEFVINLKVAKALNLEIPPALSARADEVIE